MRITIAAPAKVNLYLRVGALEASGYHAVSTLFCTLDLADTVVLRPAAVNGKGGAEPPLELAAAPPLRRLPDLGPPESNLAIRAARAFMRAGGLPGMPRIRLVKRIPPGGGLGGGSSDAAAVLRGLQRLNPTAVDTDGLVAIAAELGSDVPFFLLGTPLARGGGRGERLTPRAPLPPRPVVLVLPPLAVATSEAYGWLDDARAAGGAELQTARSGTAEPVEPGGWDGVIHQAANDFEDPVFRRLPVLREVRDSLREHGGSPALLAGSGSTVFGVFAERAAADTAAAALRQRFPEHRVVVTATRRR